MRCKYLLLVCVVLQSCGSGPAQDKPVVRKQGQLTATAEPVVHPVDPPPEQPGVPPEQPGLPPDPGEKGQPADPAEIAFRELLKQNPGAQVMTTTRGATAGTLSWSGVLERGGVLTVDGADASSGTLRGHLPGVPVILSLDESEFQLLEAPGPANRWSRFMILSRNRRHTAVVISWRVGQ